MNIQKLVISFISIFIYTVLLFSSTILGGLLYLNVFHYSILDQIKGAVVEDAKNSEQFNIGLNINKEMLKYGCDFGLIDLSQYGMEKYETLFCANVKAGKINNIEDVKEFFAEAYFKEYIAPVLEEKIFSLANDYLILAGVITGILFLMELIISTKATKKSLVFSVVLGIISIAFLIYVLDETLTKQINSNIPEEYKIQMKNVISTITKLIKEGMIYSVIFSFVLSTLAQSIGVWIGINKEEKEIKKKNAKKDKRKKKKKKVKLYPE